MSGKRLNDMSVEELSQLLSNSKIGIEETKKDPSDYLQNYLGSNVLEVDEFSKFILTHRLSQGENRVSSKILYKLYTAFSDDPLSYTAFQTMLQLYFPHFNTKGYLYVLLNSSPISINSATYKLLKSKRRGGAIKKAHTTQFDKFIKDMKIVDGGHYFSTHQIFYVYSMWTKKKQAKLKMSHKTLTDLICTKFKWKKASKYGGPVILWVKLDEEFKRHLKGSYYEIETRQQGSRLKKDFSPRKRFILKKKK